MKSVPLSKLGTQVERFWNGGGCLARAFNLRL